MHEFKVLSEAMSATGGTQSELLQNVVDGSTSLDKWAVFLRETLQNSNDQRLKSGSPIDFGVHLDYLSESARDLLRYSFSMPGPYQSDSGLNLASASTASTVLIVTDSNTKGLSGVVDPRLSGESSNFCNFFFFSGQLQERKTGGGTYGIGRNVLFMASRNRTIFAYSKFIENGRTVSRFMGMATSRGFSHHGRNFTGKHWWGEIIEENGAQRATPLEGDSADEAAAALGLLDRFSGTTGTAFAIVNPAFDDSSAEMESIRDALIVNAWPHLLESGQTKKSVLAEISHLGNVLPIMDPLSNDSPVRPFALAFLGGNSGFKINQKSAHFSGSLEPLAEYEPFGKELGDLKWLKQPIGTFAVDPETAERFSDFGLVACNSVALMRSSRIIVSYRPVASPSDGSNVFGVFDVDPGFETVFRKSENATHDEWQATKLRLPKKARNPIKQLSSFIDEAFVVGAQKQNASTGESHVPVSVANMLGKLITGMGVTGGGSGFNNRPKPPPNPKVRSGKLRLRESSSPQILSSDDQTTTGQFRFEVVSLGEVTPRPDVKFSVGIWLGDGFETTSPVGSSPAEVINLTLNPSIKASAKALKTQVIQADILSGALLSPGDQICVMVSYPSDSQVRCTYELVAEQGQGK